MGSLARSMLLLTVPALAVGALAGLALGVFSPRDGSPDEETPPAPSEPAPEDGPRTRPPRTRGPRVRDRASFPERSGVTRRVVGSSETTAKPFEPGEAAAYVERLSSPDESVRHECAVELLRLGGAAAPRVDLLVPTNPAGVKLRDAVVNALTVLDLNERGGNWEMLPEQARLEVRLRYFAKVVPLSSLRPERLRYWTLRLAVDGERLASGGIDAGEAAWAVLEQAAVRYETGELGSDAWTKLRAEKLGPMRAWVATLERERGSRDRLAAAREALERLGKL